MKRNPLPRLPGEVLGESRMALHRRPRVRYVGRVDTSDPANGLGCDYHPSLLTHEDLAEALTDALQTELGW
jgi:hypothetical protein